MDFIISKLSSPARNIEQKIVQVKRSSADRFRGNTQPRFVVFFILIKLASRTKWSNLMSVGALVGGVVVAILVVCE